MVFKTIGAIGLVSACAVLASAEPIQAQAKHKKWGDADAWAILINPDVGDGCYMEHTFDDGTLVQVGLIPDKNGGFFAAYNAAWSKLKDGTVGNVRFDFGKSLFGGEYVGATKDGLHGGYAFFDNPEFIKEFAKRNAVSVKGDAGNSLDLSLKGTTKAINAIRSCDAEQPKK